MTRRIKVTRHATDDEREWVQITGLSAVRDHHTLYRRERGAPWFLYPEHQRVEFGAWFYDDMEAALEEYLRPDSMIPPWERQ